jgi:hypothetical protein
MRELQLTEGQRRVVHALQSGGPAVPEALLRRIEQMQQAPRARRAPRLPARPALAGAVALAAAVVIVVMLSLGGPGRPSTVQAAELSPLPSERETPRSFVGVSYPDWAKRFGWFAVGGRDDKLGNRSTTTAFYRHTHHRIGYTVISGRPIEPPANAEVTTVKGVTLHRFRLGAQDVVTFVRNGHTCVLSGEVHRASTLVKLASAEPLE